MFFANSTVSGNTERCFLVTKSDPLLEKSWFSLFIWKHKHISWIRDDVNSIDELPVVCFTACHWASFRHLSFVDPSITNTEVEAFKTSKKYKIIALLHLTSNVKNHYTDVKYLTSIFWRHTYTRRLMPGTYQQYVYQKYTIKDFCKKHQIPHPYRYTTNFLTSGGMLGRVF